MCSKHEALIKVILNEEDELINNHREQLDIDVELAKKEMALLEEVDKPQSDIEQYVRKLDDILLKKLEMIGNMRHKLVKFQLHLADEQQLQKLYQEKSSQAQIEQEHYDAQINGNHQYSRQQQHVPQYERVNAQQQQ